MRDLGVRQRWTGLALYLLSLLGSQLTSAKAMVLVSSEIGTDTADPRIEPALNHVGIVNNGESGVYLGNYQGKSWVLTAKPCRTGFVRVRRYHLQCCSRVRALVVESG